MSPKTLDSSSTHIESKQISIIVADDHPLFRQSVKRVLEKEANFQVIGEASDGEEAIKLAKELDPNLVIMDIAMPKLNGIEATRQIKDSQPNTVVLVLTVHDDDKYILDILEAGAAGYVTKSVYGEELLQAVRGVVSGEIVLSKKIGQLLVKRAGCYPTKPIMLQSQEKLSVRELQVIKLLARGLSNKFIAAELKLGLRTVKGHVANIMSKLGVGSRVEIVITGLRAGFISVDEIK